MKIRTTYEYPPIPVRLLDWSAVDADTYDGEGCPIGTGATEAEAVADLLGKIDPETSDYLVRAAFMAGRDSHARDSAALLSIAKRWAAVDGGAWHAERHAREKAELLAETRAAIIKAEDR